MYPCTLFSHRRSHDSLYWKVFLGLALTTSVLKDKLKNWTSTFHHSSASPVPVYTDLVITVPWMPISWYSIDRKICFFPRCPWTHAIKIDQGRFVTSPSWISNHIPSKVCMELLIHSQTSTVQFHPTQHNGPNYSSMLGLKLIHVSKRAPGDTHMYQLADSPLV